METEAKLPLKLTRGWNTNSSSLFWGFYFWTECSTRSQWIIFFLPSLPSAFLVDGLWSSELLKNCLFALQYLNTYYSFPGRLEYLILDCQNFSVIKGKPSLKFECFCVVTSATWVVKDLHRNFITGVVLLLLQGNLTPHVGVLNFGFMTEVLLYSDLVIQWLDCLSDCFSQPSADRLLWDGCYCHSQIICGRNPVSPVSYILLAMNFKCTGTEGKGWSDWLLPLEKLLPAKWG